MAWLAGQVALALVLSFALSPAPAADEHAQAARRLQALQEEIAELSRSLEKARGEQGRLEARLRRSDRQIDRTNRDIRALNAELQALAERLAALRADRSEQLDALAGQRDMLARQLRAAYIGGRQEWLKLWLNQEDPAAAGRAVAYYRYFNEARLARIDAVEATLTDLRRTEAQIAEQRTTIEARRSEREQRREALVKARAERSEVLASLRARVRSEGERLQALREDEQRLQDLVAELSRTLEELVALPAEQATPFKQLKGRLRWPVSGRLQARFGERRGRDGLAWKGVMISTREGASVRAVAHGRVAFADWMRGFGLLVILDHGGGYMSLYGHNQSVYKAPGEWVDAGDMLGSAGDSGGLGRSGLYFEIRERGRPIDPAVWFGSPIAMSGGP
jgi:septal ring factor EnvC (AmiA/AmiB activator)